MAKFCTNCGNELTEGMNMCPNCGIAVNTNQPVNTATPTTNNTTPSNQSNGLATAGFVTSLISSLLCCGSFNLISLILSIVGLTNAKNCGGKGKGMAIAGIIISAVWMVIFILIVIILPILGLSISSSEEIQDILNNLS